MSDTMSTTDAPRQTPPTAHETRIRQTCEWITALVRRDGRRGHAVD